MPPLGGGPDQPPQPPDRRAGEAAVTAPRPGVRQWQNPKNGLVCLELHYSADPSRRDPLWKEQEKRHYADRAWRREQEIDWTAPAGEPVVPEYDARIHATVVPRDPKLRLLRGWDFGFVCPVVLFAQQPAFAQLQILRELCPFNTPLDQLLPMVRAISLEFGLEAGVFDAGDPAIIRPRSGSPVQTDVGSTWELLTRAGIRMHTHRPGTEVSYAQLRRRFLDRVLVPAVGQAPALVLDQGGCPRLMEALAGGFHLSDVPPHAPVATHPEKDLIDALRYLSDSLGAEVADYRQQLRKLATAGAQW